MTNIIEQLSDKDKISSMATVLNVLKINVTRFFDTDAVYELQWIIN